MNKYEEMITRQQAEYNVFPTGAAYSDQQLNEEMARLGVKRPAELVHVGGGVLVRKTDLDAYKAMLKRFDDEMAANIAGDADGNGFIYDMFRFELANHEYCITCEYEETLDALGLSAKQVIDDKRLYNGLAKATRDYMKECEANGYI